MNEDQKQWTWREQMNVALKICDHASSTLLPFLRSKVGYRTRSPASVILTSGGLFLFANPFEEGAFDLPNRPGWLGAFALCSFVLSARQRALRWRDIRRGVRIHSFSRGRSLLSFLPFSDYNARRFLDPLIPIIGGYYIWQEVSVALGVWLMFSGLCLRAVEQHHHQQHVERHLDLMDSMVSSEVVDATTKHYENHGQVKEQEAVQTGLSPELQALLKQRKKGRK